ncbi:MAG: glycyl-radical enzyme activating protein [Mailhella sp.]|nr:glycyl-radical enzyme activating protein [Mailhella sp.]
MEDVQVTGAVTNIQQFSTHDGPGIRTVVFLKGCPLHCAWCSNPETQRRAMDIGTATAKCEPGCTRCLSRCPSGALRKEGDDLNVDKALCRSCTFVEAWQEPPCVLACPDEVFTAYGKKMSVEAVLEQVEKDAMFYRYEQGGMTLSGGEALFQPDFALALLREGRRRGLHTCLETCGFTDGATLLEACAELDFLLFDIKNLNSEQHRESTGVPNERILENLRVVRERFPALPLKVRTPVIPGFNDTPEHIAAIAAFLKGLHITEYELLPYHAYGSSKRHSLGFSVPDVERPSDEAMDALRAVVRSVLG